MPMMFTGPGIASSGTNPVALSAEVSILLKQDQIKMVPADELARDTTTMFDQYRSGRQTIQEEWIRGLYDYRGEYTPQVLASIQAAGSGRSKAFVNLPRAVVGALRALLLQLLAAEQGFLWDIEPTPDPELEDINPQEIQKSLMQAASMLQVPPEQAMAVLQKIMDPVETRLRIAIERMERMRRTMNDQITETGLLESLVRNLDPLLIYGTGVFEGPLSRKKRPGRWIQGKDGKWKSVLSPPPGYGKDAPFDLTPYFDPVDLWNLYPDPVGCTVEEMDGIIRRRVTNRHGVRKLMDSPGFSREAIMAILDRYQDGGNWVAEPWEGVVHGTSWTSASYSRFTILEHTRWISGRQLKDLGIPGITEEMREFDCLATVWSIDEKTIKVGIAPPGTKSAERLPYYFCPYETVPGRIWGRGVPAQMKNSTALYNSATRAEVDNMAWSVGPEVGIDLARISERTDVTTHYPMKTWFFKNFEGGQLPISFFQPASNVQHMELIKESVLRQIQRETSLPDFAQGLPGASQHNRTAEGAAMQQNAALTFTRSVVGNIDTYWTGQMMTSLYHWNMDFNPNEEIKGDLKVVATGVMGAIAKDVLNTRISILMNGVGDELKYHVNPAKTVEYWLKGGGLSEKGLTNPPELAHALKMQDAQMKAEVAAAPKRMQPVVPPQNAALEILSKTEPTSALYGPAYETALNANGLMNPKFAAALNATNEAAAALNAQAMTPPDAAKLAEDIAAGGDPNAPPQQGAPAPPPDDRPPMVIQNIMGSQPTKMSLVPVRDENGRVVSYEISRGGEA